MKLFEIIDLYKLHDNPETLYGYDRAYDQVPQLVWEKITKGKVGYKFTKQEKEELKKREHLWAQDPEIAYYYARYVIKGRWPPGEDAIAKTPNLAYHYAIDVIRGRFPAGEDAIAKDDNYAYRYAHNIIKDPNFWEKKKQGLIK